MEKLEHNMTRYLLGELSEKEQAAFEERYFRDPQVFNQVLQVESELVDAYARGRLATEMRERFENSYLKHPARRQRVEFAKALTARIDEQEDSKNRVAQTARSTSRVSWWQSLLAIFGGERPKLRFALALATLLIMLAGVWIVANNLRRQQGAQIQAQRENQERLQPDQSGQTPQQTPKQQDHDEHTAQIPPATSQPSPSPVTKPAAPTVSLALTVGGVRGAGGGPTQTLFIPSDTTQAQIVLNLKDDSYPLYRASLQKIGGPKIFTQTNIRPRNSKAGAKFVFTVRASQLTKGDYALTLSGITPQGEVDDLSKSLFRVAQK